MRRRRATSCQKFPTPSTGCAEISSLARRRIDRQALPSWHDWARLDASRGFGPEGRRGRGKSLLVRHFLEQLHDSAPNAVVLTGRCYERESVPYKALDSLVDSLSRYLSDLPRDAVERVLPPYLAALARLFPALLRVDAIAQIREPGREIPDSQEFRRRGFAAFRALLAPIGERQPLVLFIDDLQWGDADSAALLTDVLSPPDPPVLLLVAC